MKNSKLTVLVSFSFCFVNWTLYWRSPCPGICFKGDHSTKHPSSVMLLTLGAAKKEEVHFRLMPYRCIYFAAALSSFLHCQDMYVYMMALPMPYLTFDRMRIGISCSKFINLRIRSVACCIGGAHPEAVNSILQQFGNLVGHAGASVHHLEPEMMNKV